MWTLIGTAVATQTWAKLTAAELQTALNGTSDYGNITAVNSTNDNITATHTLLGTTTMNSILMIENDTNIGEYKVFNVTTTNLDLANETFTVSLVGIVDFGESIVGGTSDVILANFA